ncbi:serine/threonine-protein kinase SBK1-like [Astyanax mexicanus]|uniref:SH3 domain binding kinase 1 n=1 Tax=Astyanax mexicanus TaxID=7994 RepID=A0A8B9HLR0_ASTMX|nr:serine/threonine-protein kinase SBK1-like [Astyanax mexicanus]
MDRGTRQDNGTSLHFLPTAKMTAATRVLDELCHLTAQSLTVLDPAHHFQIIKLLGEGSYGKVMLAVHKTRGTPMALKFFPRESTSLLSFLREYNLCLAYCAHPSLTSALGIAFSTPTHFVFAQQPGLYGDLYDVIIAEMGLEEICAQRVASQISGALSHLHSLGFVHRDVKPENIFLCDRDCHWVKLGDFGMVKAVGTRVPCVWYSSPYCTPEAEIARKKEASDLRSLSVDENANERKEETQKTPKKHILVSVETSTDSWALGILIYAMLMGKLPWSESVPDNVAYNEYILWTERVRTLTENCKSKGQRDFCHIAPQFTGFTTLACSMFQALLHPDPNLRVATAEVAAYLGGAWLQGDDISG